MSVLKFLNIRLVFSSIIRWSCHTANSFIRNLKIIHEEGGDIGLELDGYTAWKVQRDYNKYSLLVQELNKFFGIYEVVDEPVDINKFRDELIDKMGKIVNQ
eukprot:SAG31_NODE_9876_length_1217_cov_2.236136_2_plen_101_part_00